ncbi:MAG TPA: UvrB/UvrC motif-containing protein [Gemmatimonadaceae bacterium]|nr:UvrB/UvrC motif-containing protein [Gemmatimonadaceae bacterium]
MLCDACRERDAVIQVTQVTEPPLRQLNLCEKCAAERGIETQLTVPKQPLTDFILAVQQKTLPASAMDAVKCSFCGGTLRDFKNTGRLGCAYCYDAFESNLRDLLRRVHGNSRHQGRSYAPPAAEVEAGATVLAELRDRLKRAIDAEQFEEAAKLRDQIKATE